MAGTPEAKVHAREDRRPPAAGGVHVRAQKYTASRLSRIPLLHVSHVGQIVICPSRTADRTGEELDMGYADHGDSLDDYEPGIEGTRVFPAMAPASRERARRERAWRERAWRMRLDRWVIAAGSITGAVAVYVAFT